MSNDFCHFELATPDVEAAKAFYGAMCPSWQFMPFPMPDESGATYTLINPGAMPGGGMYQTGGESPMPMPPCWTVYVKVEDLAEMVGRARELGAEIYEERIEIPGIGLMALLADPIGALFAMWQPGGDPPEENEKNETANAFCWAELHTRELDRAKGFYSELFAWDFEDMEMPTGQYVMIKPGEGPGGGMLPIGEEFPDKYPNQWGCYILVEDADAALARARELGASEMAGVMDVGFGRFCIVRDPTGAQVSFWQNVGEGGG